MTAAIECYRRGAARGRHVLLRKLAHTESASAARLRPQAAPDVGAHGCLQTSRLAHIHSDAHVRAW